MRTINLRALVLLAMISGGPKAMASEVRQAANGKYAEVNGLKMYYEIHGAGRPLVLLHGAFGFATVYPSLAKDRQTIAVELQGHGHTADRDRPNTYVNIVEFPSYDDAMKNSEAPATKALSEKMMKLADGPPTFRNLDVKFEEN